MTGDLRPTALLVHPGAEMFGSDRMLLESATGLIEAGARVIVALPSRGPLDAELRAAGAEVVVIPMLVLRKVLLTPRGLPRLFRDTFRGLGAAWRLVGSVRPDVVYVSTTIIPQWPLVARFRRIRTVSHVHEAEASGSRWVNRILYSPHLVSQRTLMNSHFSLDTVRTALPRLARRSHVVYNGVASPAEPSSPRPSIEGPLRVLYIGRLSPRKGPDLVITAASLLKSRGRPVDVTLLGAVFDGYEWFERDLRAQAEMEEITIDFAGFEPDIWPFLGDADVLVVPSRAEESFGNTAVEGLLALRPVIASDSSGLREAAGGYTTARLIPADDAEALASALAETAEDWSLITATTEKSRAEALHRHSPRRYREAIAALVLPERPRSEP